MHFYINSKSEEKKSKYRTEIIKIFQLKISDDEKLLVKKVANYSCRYYVFIFYLDLYLENLL